MERTSRRQRAERVMFSMREVLLGLRVERDWAGPDLWEGGRYTEREPLSSTVSGYCRDGFSVLTIWSWCIMKVFRSSTFMIKIFWRILVGASLAYDRVIFTQDVISTSTTLFIATSDTAGRHLSKSFINW